MASRKRRGPLFDVRVKHGADVANDHQLLQDILKPKKKQEQYIKTKKK